MTALRLATYNLLHALDVRTGRVDLDAAAAAVAALGADVVAVQEVDRGLPRSGDRDQVAELAARLGRTGVFAPALLGDPTRSWRRAGTDPGGPAYGIGLLSVLPPTDVAVTALPGGGDGRFRLRSPDARRPPLRDREPRAALRVRVAGVAVTTTHLSYLPWRARRQLAAAAAFAGDGVLLGDFNLRPAAVARILGPLGWHTAAAGATFPSWRPALQLDHVLVRGPTLHDLRVGPPGPSDHLPLSATVRL